MGWYLVKHEDNFTTVGAACDQISSDFHIVIKIHVIRYSPTEISIKPYRSIRTGALLE